MAKEGILIEEHTVKGLFNKLDAQDKKLDKIHAQTKLTNGRVTHLEAKSLGMWISQHPFKFLAIGLFFIALLVQESRTLLFGGFLKVFGL